MKTTYSKAVYAIIFLAFIFSCAPQVVLAPYTPSNAVITEAIQDERDEIYMLAAYAVVLNDWQDGSGKKRGHNIGSVLVAPDGRIVNWARNCNAALSNGTQHGEVRLMVGYLNRFGGYSLKDHAIYTSLEPCAQCSGMMVLCNIKRTVYGQTDPGFGKAIERLALDSKKWNEKGYLPYPRQVISDRSKSKYCTQLEEAYKQAGGPITRFLLTAEAKSIFMAAAEELQNFTLNYPEANKEILDHVRSTMSLVKPGVPAICIKEN